jgi:hypothetical protein
MFELPLMQLYPAFEPFKMGLIAGRCTAPSHPAGCSSLEVGVWQE